MSPRGGTVSDHEAVEREIAQALLEQWDPLGLRDQPGPHPEYDRFAHEIYSLLARGASDTQIARFLHKLEPELGHPELVAVQLTPLLTRLRALERTI
jgi:hypothetical protein